MDTSPQPMPETNQPLQKAGGPGIAPAVGPFIFAGITCAIVILLFSPVGIIYDKVNLSFLMPPLMCLFLIRLCAKLSGLYLPGYTSFRTGMSVEHALNGLAYALFFYLLLDNALLLTRLSLFKHIEGFLTELGKTPGFIVILIAGTTAGKLADITRQTEIGKMYSPIIKALGQFFAGFGIWQFLAVFSEPGGAWGKIGLIIFAGVLAIALSNAGRYGLKSKNPFVADASNWLIGSPSAKFIIGALIAIYVILIRPAIVDVFRYASIIEWLFVCLIGWRLFSGIKNGIRSRYTLDIHETDWAKHVQLINNLHGAELPRLGAIQEIFTAEGERDTLVIYLTLLLHENRISAEETQRILHPLINYRDEKMPWFAFAWEQRRVRKRNEASRRAILEEIMTNLKYIINPSSRKIEEHADEQN